jgi:mxaK protein
MLGNGHKAEIAARPATTAAAHAAHRIGEVFTAAKGTVLWIVLAASAVTLVVCAALYAAHTRTNGMIASLRAGNNVEIDVASASPARLEARIHFLLTRDRLDEAQPLLDQAAQRADPAVESRMLYNMANARLRAAVEFIQQGHFDQAIPLVSLAKAEYRSVLRRDPGNWNAKHNLDVAMRLVRDLPRAQGGDDDDPEQIPSKLWTDLPGVPKGLP